MQRFKQWLRKLYVSGQMHRPVIPRKPTAGRRSSGGSYRRKRNYRGEEQNDVIGTQAAVCILLLVLIFAISRIDSQTTQTFSQDLKVALSKNATVETMAQSAQDGIDKAGGFIGRMKSFFGFTPKERAEEPEAPDTTTESQIVPSPIEAYSEETTPETTGDGIDESVLEEMNQGKEVAPREASELS